jgi:hypothetical protein
MEDGLVRAKRTVTRAIAANAGDPNACPFVVAADGAYRTVAEALLRLQCAVIS